MINAIIINTHAEIVLIVFGFAFIQTNNFLASTAYATKDKKSKITYVVIKINELNNII